MLAGLYSDFYISLHNTPIFLHQHKGALLVTANHIIGHSQAIIRLDCDFGLGLPLGKKPTIRERREMITQRKKQEADREAKEREGEELFEIYLDALKRFTELNSWLKKYRPTTEDEDLHPLFVEALKFIEAAEYNLNCAEIERSKYERRFSNT